MENRIGEIMTKKNKSGKDYFLKYNGAYNAAMMENIFTPLMIKTITGWKLRITKKQDKTIDEMIDALDKLKDDRERILSLIFLLMIYCQNFNEIIE